MCKHHWMIDSQNFGVCKLCRETRDFQPGVTEFFGPSKLPRIEERLVRSLSPSFDYPMQGIVHYPNQYRTVDYRFSVDDIE